jgi:hypothetical protein
MLELQRFHHGVGDPLANLIAARQQTGGNLQPCPGSCVPDIAEQDLESTQGLASPIEADLTEQAMLNRVPLRAARRVMADRHRQAEPVTQLALQLLFPQARVTAIAAACIGQDQQLPGLRIGPASLLPPPLDKSGDSKLRRIRRGADIDSPLIALEVVEAIGHGTSQRVGQKVMGIDLQRLLRPGLARVPKAADQLFLLRIHAQDRPARSPKCLFLRFDILKLPVALRMLRARFFLLSINVQRVIVLFQQPPNGRGAYPVAALAQSLTQLAQARPHPLTFTGRIPRCLRLDPLQQFGLDQRVFFSTGGRPPPASRTRSVGRSASETSSSRRPRRIVCGSRPVIWATS